MLCFKVYWHLTIGEDTPETSLVLLIYFMEQNMMKFKTVVLCLKPLACFIVQRSFIKTLIGITQSNFIRIYWRLVRPPWRSQKSTEWAATLNVITRSKYLVFSLHPVIIACSKSSVKKITVKPSTQLTFTCLKSTIQSLKQCVKSVKSYNEHTNVVMYFRVCKHLS